MIPFWPHSPMLLLSSGVKHTGTASVLLPLIQCRPNTFCSVRKVDPKLTSDYWQGGDAGPIVPPAVIRPAGYLLLSCFLFCGPAQAPDFGSSFQMTRFTSCQGSSFLERLVQVISSSHPTSGLERILKGHPLCDSFFLRLGGQ